MERLAIAMVIYITIAAVAWALSVLGATMALGALPSLHQIFDQSLIDGLLWPLRLIQMIIGR